jgi:hypothetical protein
MDRVSLRRLRSRSYHRHLNIKSILGDVEFPGRQGFDRTIKQRRPFLETRLTGNGSPLN